MIPLVIAWAVLSWWFGVPWIVFMASVIIPLVVKLWLVRRTAREHGLAHSTTASPSPFRAPEIKTQTQIRDFHRAARKAVPPNTFCSTSRSRRSSARSW